MKIQIFSSISQFQKEEWDALAPLNHPFLDYNFLKCLEDSKTIDLPHYWKPFYFSLWKDEKLCAALVAYEKYDSYGEFVFDFAWADFYNRNGLNYYPKLVVGIPFTPATGERILSPFVIPAQAGIPLTPLDPDLRQDDTLGYKKELLQALLLFTHQKNYSGIHFLFQTEEETQLLEECGFQRWLGYQFHWKNKNYKVFEVT